MIKRPDGFFVQFDNNGFRTGVWSPKEDPEWQLTLAEWDNVIACFKLHEARTSLELAQDMVKALHAGRSGFFWFPARPGETEKNVFAKLSPCVAKRPAIATVVDQDLTALQELQTQVRALTARVTVLEIAVSVSARTDTTDADTANNTTPGLRGILRRKYNRGVKIGYRVCGSCAGKGCAGCAGTGNVKFARHT